MAGGQSRGIYFSTCSDELTGCATGGHKQKRDSANDCSRYTIDIRSIRRHNGTRLQSHVTQRQHCCQNVGTADVYRVTRGEAEGISGAKGRDMGQDDHANDRSEHWDPPCRSTDARAQKPGAANSAETCYP